MEDNEVEQPGYSHPPDCSTDQLEADQLDRITTGEHTFFGVRSPA